MAFAVAIPVSLGPDVNMQLKVRSYKICSQSIIKLKISICFQIFIFPLHSSFQHTFMLKDKYARVQSQGTNSGTNPFNQQKMHVQLRTNVNVFMTFIVMVVFIICLLVNPLHLQIVCIQTTFIAHGLQVVLFERLNNDIKNLSSTQLDYMMLINVFI